MQCALVAPERGRGRGIALLEAEAFGLQYQSASRQVIRDRERWLPEGRHGIHTALGCAWSPVRPGRGLVCGRGFRLEPLVHLAGRCIPAGLPAGLLVPQDIEFLVIPVLLGMLNGLVHHRFLTNRSVTWHWMLLLSAAYIALATAGVVIGGGFRSFIFLGYYPTLAVFAVAFWPSWFSLAWRRPG